VGRVILFLMLAGMGVQAQAATRVSVAQAEEILRLAQGLPDGKAAEKIAGLAMTERVSSARLGRWEAEFKGEQSRVALFAVADASAFLDLPVEEIPALVKPEAAARRAILVSAVGYVNTTIHKLPNFSALRTTTHFDNVPASQREYKKYFREQRSGYLGTAVVKMAPPAEAEPLRVGDWSSTVVAYRDGHEEVDARAGKAAAPVAGLTTSGEFGPILSIVVGDALKGEMFWDHWEHGESGVMAAFRYAVAKEQSHYTVVGADGKARFPAYHGQIAVDPKDGTILRVTLVSELDAPERAETAILVEYGPVTIGGSTYTCPVRGVAFSQVPNAVAEEYYGVADGKAQGAQVTIPPETFVNDVSFTEYHVFKADVRVVP